MTMINGIDSKQYHRQWYIAHKDQIANKRKGQWSRFTKEQRLARTLATEKCRVKRQYGLEWDEYLLLKDKITVCPICELPFEKRQGKVIDHTTNGTYHGVICTMCNASIGAMLHSVNILRRAAGYVASTR